MPRTARNILEGGYRHVIVRGIGKQILFEDEKDNGFFLRLLKKYSLETNVKVCAYCLMENHVHLLIHDLATDTAVFMKKIGVSYSAYFNKKYERTGHLFQDRYKSENISDERGYLTVLRYILRNPEKAGFCRTEEYRWSSFSSYEDATSFLEQTLTWRLFENRASFRDFILWNNPEHGTEDGMEPKNSTELENGMEPKNSTELENGMEPDGRMDDGMARKKIRDCLGVQSGTVLQSYGRAERNRALRELKNNGLTIRQIERLTGINRGVIQRA